MLGSSLRRCAMVLVVAAAGASACATSISTTRPTTPSPRAVRVDEAETRHCLRLTRVQHLMGPSPDLAVGPRPPDIPEVLWHSAHAAGIEDHLLALRHADESPEQLVERRLEVVTRLSSLEIQLAALLFEADCVGDQMEAVLSELERRDRRREVALTVASILVGAGASIGAGVWELRGENKLGPPVMSLVGGGAAAALGIAAFVPWHGAVIYAHPRNLLEPILSGEDPGDLYPEFVFTMLTQAGPDGETPRDLMLRDWRRILDETIPAKHRALAEQVLYGPGGVYDARLIDARERMFDALESHLASVQRNLEQLYLFSDRMIDAAEIEDEAKAETLP